MLAAAYYHPDAVLVHKGKECKYGRPAIQQLLEEFDKMVGESTTKLSGDTYQMSTDYIIITSNYETTSEKSGVIKGKFLQIWKKENNTYLIYHDEFDMQ
ncbi:unnamed protein product [Nippostrongylus brasiliensis]|uniref:DUF4440 domain-containing protein n=1 Tax=Nippostrongylus brasiliensis TaxID=27835 RepID=A0A0N4Y7E7_NIPBR|nr:unnamed protein product [Nippostrongylus brasiliensis]